MTQLTQCLQELFAFLAKQQLLPPSRDVRIIEIRRDTPLDVRGRFRVPRNALREPSDFESRFEEIAKYGLPWVNMSCYGVHEGLLIVGIELPEAEAKDRPSTRLIVNYSGPAACVIEHGWQIDPIAVIE